MAKQKCGSCHFFQESDLPGSGWCNHPQRKVSSDVKILVRRNELACRDEWSRSLWQPSAGPPAGTSALDPSPGYGPLPPASPEDLRAFLNRDARTASAEGEDVLLSEGRFISEAREPFDLPPRPIAVGNFDPRTAIFRAREAHRERIRAKAAAARQSAGAEAIAASRDPGMRADQSAAVPSNHTRPDQTNIDPGVQESDAVLGQVELEQPDELESHSGLTGRSSPAAADTVSGIDVPDSVEDLRAFVAEPGFESTRDTAERGEVCVPDPLVSGREEIDLAAESRTVAPAQEFPVWFRSDLPRMCRTCRDFRPAAGGQRGWCANAWAFTHRQLVDDDDIAPCHSAIGDWWVPVDDVWLVAADVSTHGRPTPLLDRHIAGETAQRRRS